MKPARLEDNMENTQHLEPLWFDADLYTVGSPCQPWSFAGSKEGATDLRGSLMALIPAQIDKHKPRSFLAENVFGLMSLFPKEFNWLIQTLRNIQLPNGQPCALALLNFFFALKKNDSVHHIREVMPS